MTNDTQDFNGVDGARLLSYIERIEHIEEEKKALLNDIKEIYEEAKAAGFDAQAIKEIIKQRKIDSTERQEMEFVLDVYKRAIGLK